MSLTTGPTWHSKTSTSNRSLSGFSGFPSATATSTTPQTLHASPFALPVGSGSGSGSRAPAARNFATPAPTTSTNPVWAMPQLPQLPQQQQQQQSKTVFGPRAAKATTAIGQFGFPSAPAPAAFLPTTPATGGGLWQQPPTQSTPAPATTWNWGQQPQSQFLVQQQQPAASTFTWNKQSPSMPSQPNAFRLHYDPIPPSQPAFKFDAARSNTTQPVTAPSAWGSSFRNDATQKAHKAHWPPSTPAGVNGAPAGSGFQFMVGNKQTLQTQQIQQTSPAASLFPTTNGNAGATKWNFTPLPKPQATAAPTRPPIQWTMPTATLAAAASTSTRPSASTGSVWTGSFTSPASTTASSPAAVKFPTMPAPAALAAQQPQPQAPTLPPAPVALVAAPDVSPYGSGSHGDGLVERAVLAALQPQQSVATPASTQLRLLLPVGTAALSPSLASSAVTRSATRSAAFVRHAHRPSQLQFRVGLSAAAFASPPRSFKGSSSQRASAPSPASKRTTTLIARRGDDFRFTTSLFSNAATKKKLVLN